VHDDADKVLEVAVGLLLVERDQVLKTASVSDITQFGLSQKLTLGQVRTSHAASDMATTVGCLKTCAGMTALTAYSRIPEDNVSLGPSSIRADRLAFLHVLADGPATKGNELGDRRKRLDRPPTRLLDDSSGPALDGLAEPLHAAQ
jgi:hypothetical protein